MTESDREALYEVASDPKIWEQHPQPLRYQRGPFDLFFNTLLTFPGPLIALDAKTGAVIGTSSYYEFRPDERHVSIGYTFLARSHWGHSTNREMKRLMLDHAFQHVDTVYFHIGDQNRRSQAAIQKIGAVQCGEEQRTLPDQTTVRSFIYKIAKVAK